MNPQPSVLVGIAQEIACAVFIAPMMLPQGVQHPEQGTQEFESGQAMLLPPPTSDEKEGRGDFILNPGEKKEQKLSIDGWMLNSGDHQRITSS